MEIDVKNNLMKVIIFLLTRDNFNKLQKRALKLFNQNMRLTNKTKF